MDKQEAYQEAEIKALWGQGQPERRLPLAKNYLLGLVLESLRRQHRGKTLSRYLREQADYIELLFQKGQIDLAMRWLQRTRKKAEKVGETVVQLELIQWEKRLIRSKAGNQIGEKLERLADAELACSTLIHQETILKGIRDKLYGLIVQRVDPGSQEAQAKINQWVNHSLLLQPPDSLSPEAKLAYHFVHVYHNQMLDNYALVLDQYRAMVTLWENWPEKQKWESQRYITTLYLYLDGCYQSGKTDEFERVLPVIQSFKPKEKKDQAFQFSLVNQARFRYYLNASKFKEASYMETEIKSGLNKYKKHLNPSIVLSFYYNLVILFFILGSYAKAIHWLNHIIHHKSRDTRQDLQAGARILQLICHFETGDLDTFHSLLPAAKRFLIQRLNAPDFVQVFTKGLSHLSQLSSNPTKPAWKTFRKDLLEVMQKMPTPVICKIELRAWLDAHCEGTNLEKSLSQLLAKEENG